MSPPTPESKDMPHTLKVAHSPDADDKLMFWALKKGLISDPEFHFDIVEADTQQLNGMADTLQYDIIAISAAHYAHVAPHYQPLRMGSSVGDGYGPVLLAPSPQQAKEFPAIGSEELKKWTLLTPGRATTAHHALRALGYTFGTLVEIPIVPIERSFTELRERSQRDANIAALIIHEGRLIYESKGAALIFDVGQEWKNRFGCSLPLGINVIRRGLSEDQKQRLSQLLRESMAFGMKHLTLFEEEYCAHGAGTLNPDELRSYLKMYANETTLDITDADKAAFEQLLGSVLGASVAEKGHQQTDWI